MHNRFLFPCFVVLSVIGAGLFAGESPRAAAARTRLTEGVAFIDTEGLPGPVMCLTDDAFPLGACQHWEGTFGFAAAGAFYGDGRCVYLGHDAYLTKPSKADTGRLLANAVAWLAQDKPDANVVVVGRRAITTPLAAVGVKPQFAKTVEEAVKSADVIVMVGFTSEDAAPLQDFVRKGGGLLGAGLGWGYKQVYGGARTVSLSQDFPDNQVFGAMGILMGDMGTRRPVEGKGYPILTDYRAGSRTTDALDLMLASGASEDRERVKQCSKIISLTLDALPANAAPELMEKLRAFARIAGDAAVPSPEKPIGPGDLAARLAQIVKKNDWQANPVKVWPADPAHTVYPGAVKPGYTTETRTVTIDCARTRWHFTGLYSPAGESLTVTLPDGAEKLGLSLRVGTSKEDLTPKEIWRRAPLVSLTVPLDRRETTLATPYGGLVYIVVPDSADPSVQLTLTVSGGIAAPWFRLGRDTNDTFARQIAASHAPMGEIEGDLFAITLPTAALANVSDAVWIATFWDRVVAADRELAALPPRRHGERACGDVQLEGGDFHNGYPLMFHLNGTDHEGIASRASQEAGLGWGFYHEIGHNHQSHDWTPDGMAEVTVNLFTCHTIEKVCGHKMRDRRFGAPSTLEMERRVNKWIAGGKSFARWKADPFLALEMYLRFAEAYGWEIYPKVFAEYGKPGAERPKDNQAKWDLFAKRLSEATGDNIAAVMSKWSVPVSEAAEKACAGYKSAPESLTLGIDSTYVDEVNFYTLKAADIPSADPGALYLGISLVTPDIVESYTTREAIPGGEQDSRWKTDWLLMRRIEQEGAPFYIAVYETTQSQYAHIAGEWASGNLGTTQERDTLPVSNVPYDKVRGSHLDQVNWPESKTKVGDDSFLARLRSRVGFRIDFDLPTNAQWEFAARAGTTGARYSDEPIDKLGRYAGNGTNTVAVGSYLPNAWGLYDCYGNVSELCLDRGTKKQGRRIVRGGSFKEPADHCDSVFDACGLELRPRLSVVETGFRLVMPAAVRARPCAMNGTMLLDGEAAAARAAILKDAAPVLPDEFPSPVAILNDKAFPLLAGRNFDHARKQPATQGLFAAAAFYGKGRIVVVGEESVARDAKSVFGRNVRRWLANGKDLSSVRVVAASAVQEADVPAFAKHVANGGGLLIAGSFWRWQAEVEERTGHVLPPSAFPANKLLMPMGLAILPYGLARDATDGFSAQTLFRLGITPEAARAARASKTYASLAHERQVANTLRAFAELADTVVVTNGVPSETRVMPPPYPAPAANGCRIRTGDKIVFLGDSITRLGGSVKGGWIDQVLEGLAAVGVTEVEAVRAGCDGNNAGDMLNRIDGLLAQPGVTWLTLSCGVNDIWGFDWQRGVMLADYKRNMRAMLDRAARAKVNVILLTPTFVGEDLDNEKNQMLRPFVAFLRDEANARGLILCDMNKAEEEGLAAFPKDGTKRYTYDGVHPIDAGHRLFAENVLKAMGVTR